MTRLGVLLIFSLAFALTVFACENIRTGCKIEDLTCVCGSGCVTEYRYQTKEECHRGLKAKRKTVDICTRNPCRNNGACSQINQEPGYRCRCEGTGFYGDRCQYNCELARHLDDHRYPYECVII